MPTWFAGRARVLVAAAVAAVPIAGAAALALNGDGTVSHVIRGTPKAQDVNLDPAAVAKARRSVRAAGDAGGHAQVVVAVPPGQASAPEPTPSTHSHARAQTDAEVQQELSLFRRPLPSTNLSALATVMWDGRETFSGKSIHFDLTDQANGATLGHAAATDPLSSD